MNRYSDYQAIILAAGCSRRMKAFKPLLPLGNTCILEHTIDNFIRAGIRRIIVVVGYRRGELIPFLIRKRVQYVINSRYEDLDMFESVRLGVEALQDDCRGFLLCPGDIPLIMPYTIQRVIEEREKTQALVVMPSYRGESGHPPVMSREVIPSIRNYRGEEGLRGVLQRYEADTRYVEVPDREMLYDMDMPEDYERLKTAYARREIPDLEVCEDIFRHRQTPETIQNHARTVAGLALEIGEKINTVCREKKLPQLSLDLLQAAGLLHDIARMEKHHARAGANLLRKMGFDRTAWVVEAHKSLHHGWDLGVNEETILFLADHMVLEDRRCTLQERHQAAQKKYGDRPGLDKKLKKDAQYFETGLSLLEIFLGCALFD
ncbi:MAG: DVU_1551 family NTP transferase [Lachnospiraceae bacterium]|jgi:molybdenum cofactor cytidylyltransferase